MILKSKALPHIGIVHALLATVVLATTAYTAEEDATRREPYADDEGDSAAFTVVISADDGDERDGVAPARCSGALIALRTALTSARCAGSHRALWARATPPNAHPALARVLRVATPSAADDLSEEHGWSQALASRDVALLELEHALGGARPIVLGTARVDCQPAVEEGGAWHLVRVLEGRMLRIVELALAPPRVCWDSLSDERALCLTGPHLCLSDRGAGVVRGGKLCGILSGSGGAEGLQRAEGCGSPHAASSAVRWRRFLHCAHSRGLCGRVGECAQLCSERWLTEEPPAAPLPFVGGDLGSAPLPLAPITAAPTPSKHTELTDIESLSEAHGTTRAPPTHSQTPPPPPPKRTSPPPMPVSRTSAQGGGASTARLALEFEPNRADFTAGEYGDNAADYVAPDEPGMALPVVPSASTARSNAATPAAPEFRLNPANATRAPSSRAVPPVARSRHRLRSQAAHTRDHVSWLWQCQPMFITFLLY